jgi:hypothetical protein
VAVGAEAEVVALSAFLLNTARAIVDRFDRCFLILALTVAISGGAVLARDMPAPPCAGPPTPVYPSAPDVPAIDVWLDQNDLDNWHAPACLDWEDRPTTVLIAVAGRFQQDGTSDELLDRLGAASRYSSISYWSWSRQRWRNLFEKSVALSARERSAERKDFKADELQKGDQVFILQDESGPVGEVIQRLSIIDRTDDRIEIGVTNVTPARIAIVTLFEPGGSDMRLWLERQSPDQWTYYSLTRLSGSALLARPALERSYANRAEAMFRHLTSADRLENAH